jgi:hypothetical protein
MRRIALEARREKLATEWGLDEAPG